MMGISIDFMIFLGCILGTIILLQVILAVLVYKNRNTSTLKLHQSYVLLFYVAIAAFSTGSCILFIPFSDETCMIMDIFILLPITIMGNILVSRSWRLQGLVGRQFSLMVGTLKYSPAFKDIHPSKLPSMPPENAPQSAPKVPPEMPPKCPQNAPKVPPKCPPCSD